VAAIATAVLILLAVACSSESPPSSTPPLPATEPTTSITNSTTEADSEVAFVRGLTSHTVEGVDAASGMTVPGSPAALYVDFERLRDDVRREAGVVPAPDNVQRQDDRVVMSAPLVGMYRAFMDFGFDGNLIRSFSVASVPIDELVVGAGETATVAGDTYEIVGARIDSLNAFEVVVKVTGGSPGTALPMDASLNTTDGPVASDAKNSVPRTESSPGEPVLAYYEFFNPSDIISITLHVCTKATSACGDVTLGFQSTQTA